MAVQAQFPSNPPLLLSPHFRPRARDDVLLDEIHMIHDRSLLRAHAHAHAQFDAAYNNNNSGCGGAWAEENELVTPPPQNGPVPIQARVVAPAIDVGGGASTSGRPAGEDVVSHLHRQSAEIDAFVRLEVPILLHLDPRLRSLYMYLSIYVYVSSCCC
ncbi:uncharacterized protein LOC109705002 [Ananas comosus]|uniref:Uncharacterized protein LOC109705002 n=1 Tax=Ananas comosus TaxID=4615 RepID=A0A6P5EIN2_ANACO|nr:uncharacterized protein LOC109705002 [Ananas comosus]